MITFHLQFHKMNIQIRRVAFTLLLVNIELTTKKPPHRHKICVRCVGEWKTHRTRAENEKLLIVLTYPLLHSFTILILLKCCLHRFPYSLMKTFLTDWNFPLFILIPATWWKFGRFPVSATIQWTSSATKPFTLSQFERSGECQNCSACVRLSLKIRRMR